MPRKSAQTLFLGFLAAKHVNVPETPFCANCGGVYKKVRKAQKYCCGKCRAAGWRKTTGHPLELARYLASHVVAEMEKRFPR